MRTARDVGRSEPNHHRRQSKGWRRQDHHGHQPGDGAFAAIGEKVLDHRSRSAGQCQHRPWHRPAGSRAVFLRPSCRQSATIAAKRRRATDVPNLWIVPSTMDLLGVEMEIASQRDRVFKLKQAVATDAAGSDYRLHSGGLPALPEPLDHQCDGSRPFGSCAAAVRVLRARRA